MGGQEGYIYALLFDSPISPDHTTQAYIGWADDLAQRIEAHRKGYAAVLTRVAKEREIGWHVARVWRGDRNDERRIKNAKQGRRYATGERNISYLPELTREEIDNLLSAPAF